MDEAGLTQDVRTTQELGLGIGAVAAPVTHATGSLLGAAVSR